MKNALSVVLLFLSFVFYAQQKMVSKSMSVKPNTDLVKLNDSIPALIPQKIDDKYGFVNQKGKVIIKPEYSNVGFFTEDCNLLNSPNPKVKKFGSAKYASVHLNGQNFRINESGTRVYQFRKSDLGQCTPEFKAQLFHAYIMNNTYGIIEDAKFENPGDYRQFTIYPQYDYLHILEGDDLRNPMIIASYKNKFGVIDIYNKVVIPFEYSDIKRNFSWKLARLFEVTKDGKNYYYVDTNNIRY